MRRSTKLLGACAFFGFLGVGCGDSAGTSTGSGGGGGGVGQGGSTPTTATGTGGGTTSTGTGGGGSSCDQICAKNVEIEATLMCGYDGSTCVPDCDAAFVGLSAGCTQAAEDYNACLIAQPADDFACNPDGTATLTTTVCQPELDALLVCT